MFSRLGCQLFQIKSGKHGGDCETAPVRSVNRGAERAGLLLILNIPAV
jgi:hypothetical protein